MHAMETITRNEAVSLYPSLTALAKDLGVTRAAVYFWAADEPAPEWVYIKLRYVLKPDAFTESGKLKRRKARH